MLTTLAVSKKKSSDEFYETTRLIMLKKEVQIYKHLPDQASRKTFIKDFWKKRDPTPDSEENENKTVFYQRLAYVDKWFKEKTGKGRGWDSDRGKVFLLLGGPDERSTRQGTIIGNTGSPITVTAEIWFYDYYRVYLEFVDEDGFGRYRLRHWPIQLLSAFDRAKFTIHQDKNQTGTPFKFKAKFKNNEIKIKIPTKAINFDFDKDEDKMNARFKVTAYIYQDYKRIDKIETTRVISKSKDAFSKLKNIVLAIPYTPSAKGKYVFDIIVEDEITPSRSKYRDMISYKL